MRSMNPLRTLMAAAILCGTFIGYAQAETFGDFTYTDQGDSVTITGYSAVSFGAVNIPAEIGGKPVTAIGDKAFYCEGVTALTIPGSVISIGDYAFGACHYLKTVTIPAGVKSIGPGAFFHCDGLEKLTFSTGLSTIGEQSFAYCAKLTEVVIPDGVTSIGDGAFFNCTELEQVSIGGDVVSIGNWIFEQCGKIKRVTFASGVNTIPRWVFANCGNLTSVKIPRSVTSIDEGAFAGCRALKEVALPSSLDSIGDSAFSSTGLAIVTLPSSVESIGDSAFSRTSLTTVTIPSTVESIGRGAFGYCGALKRATFVGNAPALGEAAFGEAADSFTVYWHEGREGFTAPTWQGYAAWMIPKGPEIAVYQPHGFELVDGSGKKSYGGQRVGTKTPPRSVTIRNRGSKVLRGLFVATGGNHPDDFIIRQPEERSLPPGAVTTFKVSFKPNAKGARNATIRIHSNDADEDPFEIHFDGHGVK